MKFILLVAVIACILSITFADESEKVKQANSEVVNYIHRQLASYPMGRSAGNQFACYDDLTRKINKITDETNEKTESCINQANIDRTGTLDELKTARTNVAVSVTSVHNSFFDCTKKPVGLDYFKCLKTAIENDASEMETIKSKSEAIISQYEAGLQKIETQETKCLGQAIQSAKDDTDSGFETLKSCLGLGTAQN